MRADTGFDGGRKVLARRVLGVAAFSLVLAVTVSSHASAPDRHQSRSLDNLLRHELERAGFTGRIEESMEARLGRPIDIALADLGRLLFFDPLNGLYGDNSCAGCHSPANGLGDTQSIAIGVGNNGVVGPNRSGARNQRKAPLVINSGFFPKLMLNGRFQSLSGDPFDNSQGFQFPPPEGTTRFPANATGSPGWGRRRCRYT